MSYAQEQTSCPPLPTLRAAAHPRVDGLRAVAILVLKSLLVAAPALLGVLALYAAVGP